jgi:hypothetical protein
MSDLQLAEMIKKKGTEEFNLQSPELGGDAGN